MAFQTHIPVRSTNKVRRGIHRLCEYFPQNEASGWPKWCQTEADRYKYIEEYHQREGFVLNTITLHRTQVAERWHS